MFCQHALQNQLYKQQPLWFEWVWPKNPYDLYKANHQSFKSIRKIFQCTGISIGPHPLIQLKSLFIRMNGIDLQTMLCSGVVEIKKLLCFEDPPRGVGTTKTRELELILTLRCGCGGMVEDVGGGEDEWVVEELRLKFSNKPSRAAVVLRKEEIWASCWSKNVETIVVRVDILTVSSSMRRPLVCGRGQREYQVGTPF